MKRPQFRATPTVYKGIRMRSRLEAGYAMWLDHKRWDWTYETEAFANEAGQYYPDFRIEGVTDLVTGRTAHAYVEVKPSYKGIVLVTVLRRMEVIWDSEPEAHLLIHAPPGGRHATIVACLRRFETARADGGQTDIRSDGWATWMADPTPTLGAYLPARLGPWQGEWWKAATVLTPPAPAENNEEM